MKFQSLKMLGVATCGVMMLSACGQKADQFRDAVDLQGDYQTRPSNDVGIRTDLKDKCLVHTATFSGNKLSVVQGQFGRSDCSGDPLGEIKFEGTYKVGNLIDANTKQRELDFKIEKITATPRSDKWAQLANFIDRSGDCNIDKVAVNQPTEVTGKKCQAMGDFPAKDMVFFASYRIQGADLMLTQMPNMVDGHVGSEAAPATRLLELQDHYIHKD